MSLNKVQLIGNLGAAPVSMKTKYGNSVTLSIATSKKINKDGEKVENTTWHKVALYDKLADVAEKYLSQGDKVYIEGEIRHKMVEKDGVKKYYTDVIARQLIMLGSKKGSAPDMSPDIDFDTPPF